MILQPLNKNSNLLRVEHLLRRDVGDLDEVGQQPPVDGLRGVGHEALAPERRLLQKPWEGSGVVQVKVRDEEQVDLVGLDHVDEGERVHPGEARVDAAVELHSVQQSRFGSGSTLRLCNLKNENEDL